MIDQMLIHYASGFEHKHYLGAASEVEILDNMDGKQGFFIRVFFVNDKVNGNKWQIPWDAIKQDVNDVLGVPIVLQNDLQHPQFHHQNFFAKGYVIDYILNEDNHTVEVIARILDVSTIKLIKDGKLKFVSPAVVARDNLSLENIDGVDVLSRWIALHLAIVANPAYGTDDAKIFDTCTGKGDTCTMKLKQLSVVSVASLDSCVSTKIPIIQKENPDMDMDQVIAIAFSECKENEKGGKTYESTSNPPGSDSAKVGPLTQIPLLKNAQVDEIIKREHELLDKGIPEEDVHKMLRREFGEDEMTASDYRVASFIHYTASKLNYLKTGSMEHNGKKGEWIGAKGMKVFVSVDQTVDQAMQEQCPCQFMADEFDTVVTKTQSNYRYSQSAEVQCSTCKFFNASTNTCQVVEGFIKPGFVSDKYQKAVDDADGVTDRT